METRAQDTPWVSVLKTKDIDYSEAGMNQRFHQSSHGWVKERRVRFYLEPERYVANDWYQDKASGSGSTVPAMLCGITGIFIKIVGIILGDFAMVKGLQLIKGKPYYFNRDDRWQSWDTVYGTGGQNGVLHFPEEESAEIPISKEEYRWKWRRQEPEHITWQTEGKTLRWQRTQGANIRLVVQPPVTKAGTASEADRKRICPGRTKDIGCRYLPD